MNQECEPKTKITAEEVFQMVLDKQIESFNISICAQNSSIEIIGSEGLLLQKFDLDYNGWLVNSFRCVLQKLPQHAQIRILSENRQGVAIFRELEIGCENGEIYQAVIVSAGINNKFNSLRLHESKTNQTASSPSMLKYTHGVRLASA